ncbi:pitrilysin family protein [Oceanithermus sp.]|uniref:M16 family metallopeptidase n=1 Tax=Oceanithermus sp. TaxID=2268145 RepID=UPI00257D96BE|nr:pitrilysin family protein [Oceanithermus sp.]
MSGLTFREATLPNGLRVIAEINPEAKSTALGYFVRTGSRDELAGEEGVSHFLEHMVFKGTERRSAWDVNREFDEMGAKYNAFTNEELTVFYGAVLPEFAPRLLDLLSDLMRPALREDEFETERKVILEEIALYRDRPHFVLYERAQEAYFRRHPLAKPVLGTTESIEAMTRAQMAAYHARRYVPNNMTLAFAGNLDWDEMLALAERMTRGWSQGPAPRNHPGFTPEPRRLRTPYDKASQAYAVVMAPGHAAAAEERYAARVLADVLGDPDNGRLFWRLVDPGLAETAMAYHHEFEELGVYLVYVQGDPAHEEEVSERIREELVRLEKGGVDSEELERAKLKTATSLVFAGETSLSRLFYLGLGYSYTGRYEALDTVRRWVMHLEPYHLGELLEARPFSRALEYWLVPADHG